MFGDGFGGGAGGCDLVEGVEVGAADEVVEEEGAGYEGGDDGEREGGRAEVGDLGCKESRQQAHPARASALRQRARRKSERERERDR